MAENLAAGAAVGSALTTFDQEAAVQTLSFAITGVNCWEAANLPTTGAPTWFPEQVATPGTS